MRTARNCMRAIPLWQAHPYQINNVQLEPGHATSIVVGDWYGFSHSMAPCNTLPYSTCAFWRTRGNRTVKQIVCFAAVSSRLLPTDMIKWWKLLNPKALNIMRDGNVFSMVLSGCKHARGLHRSAPWRDAASIPTSQTVSICISAKVNHPGKEHAINISSSAKTMNLQENLDVHWKAMSTLTDLQLVQRPRPFYG